MPDATVTILDWNWSYDGVTKTGFQSKRDAMRSLREWAGISPEWAEAFLYTRSYTVWR